MGVIHRLELKIFKLDKLNRMIKDLPFNNWKTRCAKKEQQTTNCLECRYKKDRYLTNRDEIAHFCEHDGIYIHFTKAHSTWHAHAPCALKPWWLFLKPLKKNSQNASCN